MGIKHSGNSNKTISYYVCLTQVSTSYVYLEGEKCTARRVPTAIVDELVWGKLCELAENPELIAHYIQDVTNPVATIKIKNTLVKLIETEKKIRMQKETIMRWFRQRLIDTKDAEKQLDEINQQLIDIESRTKSLNTELNFLTLQASQEDIAANIKKYLKEIQCYEEHERKIALRSIIESVAIQRIDTTYARSSKPEFVIMLKFL